MEGKQQLNEDCLVEVEMDSRSNCFRTYFSPWFSHEFIPSKVEGNNVKITDVLRKETKSKRLSCVIISGAWLISR